MSDIWLGLTGGKPHVDALLAAGEIDVDRLKAAEWMDEARLAAVRAQRPVLLHLDDGVIWPRGRRWADERARLAGWCGTPWLSVHLDLGWTFLAYRWPGPSPVPRALARRWALRSVRLLKKACAAFVPERPAVLVENIPHWSRSRPAYTADPAFISAVVEESGCGFLLDLAHARVAARYQGEPVHDYLLRLPMERLVEVHVSGPRPEPQADSRSAGGRLVDAHQPMLEEDYVLLAWVLERSRPRAVTLEYSKDPAQIVAQLARLRAILDRT
jgi:uncharacterized protein (UPF0276 family)